MIKVIYPKGRGPMIKSVPNIEVCHHPESSHIVAEGMQEKWVEMGNYTFHDAAIEFVKTMSAELVIGEPVRLLTRDKNNPNIPPYDVRVHLELIYSAKPTFPERNDIDYQDSTD